MDPVSISVNEKKRRVFNRRRFLHYNGLEEGVLMGHEAMLYEKRADGKVACKLCAHRCVILPSRYGFCEVRRNDDGLLTTLVYGKTIAEQIDPIEKKPLYHFLPGTRAFSIAAPGCNFRCDFCQNWRISQVTGKERPYLGEDRSPDEIVARAKRSGCASIAYTYTEPTIFFEYTYDIARRAKDEGIRNVYVTNGYMTMEAIEKIGPFLDGANIDLKSFTDSFYKKFCRGRLAPVLKSIRRMRELDIWVEVTTLVIPGENDSEEELYDIASFISSVDNDIPWHVSAFHPDYKMMQKEWTPATSLKTALDIGRSKGLRHIYTGNDRTTQHTHCPQCGESVIKRNYFELSEMSLQAGMCPYCRTSLAGVWK